MKFKKDGKAYDQAEMMYAIMADEAMGKTVFDVAKLYGLDMISFMEKYPYAVALAFGFEAIKDTPTIAEAVEKRSEDVKPDPVNHPAHYTSGGIECIDAMQAAFGAEAVKDFCLCNAFKYLWRHRQKNGVEDLKKACWSEPADYGDGGRRMKYRKKPVVVEAVRWTGKNQTEIDKFCGMNVVWSENKKTFLVLTLEGTMLASTGDYIIKGVNGEFYPCKPDVFAKTYERVEE